MAGCHEEQEGRLREGGRSFHTVLRAGFPEEGKFEWESG